MNLSNDPARLATLKADILADPTLSSQPMNSDGAFAIAIAYNLTASPTFIVWKGVMQVDEIEQNGFAWNQLDSVPAAKYRIWERLTSSGFINPTKPNVRQGINDFAKDASGAVLTGLRDSILPHLKRPATRVEKLFATGVGTEATPGTMSVDGDLTFNDVQIARAS